jgi:hypothetical protein
MTQPVAPSAEVRAHDRVVRYRREGTSGPPVLLVAADSTSDLWPELPGLLAKQFRLLVPQLPEAPSDAAQSLRCLLEGLGCAGVPVIAAGRYCDAALELALERNEAVGRVLLVPGTTEAGETTDTRDADPTEGASADALPIYVLSRKLAVGAAFERAVEFLVAA